MIRLQKITLFLLLAISINSQAASSYSGDSLQDMYLEMQYLYQLGLEIHQRYDEHDRDQLKACDFEFGHNETRARGLIGMANRIDFPDKDALIAATWATYSCVSCGTDGKACDNIPTELENIKKVMIDSSNSAP